MTVKLNISIEMNNVSPAAVLQMKNNLRLHRITEPVDNATLINEFGLDRRNLTIAGLEQVTIGTEEHYTIEIIG